MARRSAGGYPTAYRAGADGHSGVGRLSKPETSRPTLEYAPDPSGAFSWTGGISYPMPAVVAPSRAISPARYRSPHETAHYVGGFPGGTSPGLIGAALTGIAGAWRTAAKFARRAHPLGRILDLVDLMQMLTEETRPAVHMPGGYDFTGWTSTNTCPGGTTKLSGEAIIHVYGCNYQGTGWYFRAEPPDPATNDAEIGGWEKDETQYNSAFNWYAWRNTSRYTRNLGTTGLPEYIPARAVPGKTPPVDNRDPMLWKPGQVPEPKRPPWAVIPHFRANPNRVEQTDAGNAPNIPYPTLSATKLTNPNHRREPPSRNRRERTREKKLVAPVKALTVLTAIYTGSTEWSDFIEALWKALPKKARTKWRADMSVADWRFAQMMDLWHNWDVMDGYKGLENLVNNAIEDRIIGTALGASQAGQRQARLGAHGGEAGVGMQPWAMSKNQQVPESGGSLKDIVNVSVSSSGVTIEFFR